MVLKIDNRDMRRLWLDTNELVLPPTSPLDIVSIIRKLGFVQLDTIQNVSRAHHHILWSRNQKYREPMLDELLRSKQHIFEHFTHDASILPMEFYPMWRRRFTRLKEKIDKYEFYQEMQIDDWKYNIIERITAEGPLSTKDFRNKISEEKRVWSQPPHKRILDYLWYTGSLSTSHRENFNKFYDLPERVIPKHYREQKASETEQVNWLCREALKRLAVGTLREIQAFWDAKDIDEVKSWVSKNKDELIPVEWETEGGAFIKSYALKDIEERLNNLPPVSSRIRIINPFDPAIRDRERLKNIFGFDYKGELFIPASKRRWGYYVYPLLQGECFVGRIEVKADRKSLCLNVINFWREEGVKWGAGRQKKLDSELSRFARLAKLDKVNWL